MLLALAGATRMKTSLTVLLLWFLPLLVATAPQTLLVKVGGSSITNKSQLETLDEAAIEWFAKAIQECRQNHRVVIVHGAGSFGHFTAKEFGLRGQKEAPPSHGEDESPPSEFLLQGLSETRLSVQKLNQAIVSSFVQHHIPAVGISPCLSIPGLQAHGGDKFAQTLLRQAVETALMAGLVPILHGDACLYGTNNVGILSGDTVMEILGTADWVSTGIFLTDVDGVFTADPNVYGTAELIRTIEVSKDGTLLSMESLDASGSTHDHDVTGGLETKLASAASIAAKGKPVIIAKHGSESAKQALSGKQPHRATILFPAGDSNDSRNEL